MRKREENQANLLTIQFLLVVHTVPAKSFFAKIGKNGWVVRGASWAWFENQPFSSLNEPLMISRN